MSAPTSWLWTIYNTDGVSVLATFTAQNPSYTFPAPGSYPVRLVATNDSGSGDTGPVAVLVTEPGAFAPVRSANVAVPVGSTTIQIVLPLLVVGHLVVVTALAVDPPDVTGVADSTGASNVYVAPAALQALPGGGWGKNRTFWCQAITGGADVVVTVTFSGPTTSGLGLIAVSQWLPDGTVSLLAHTEATGDAVAGPIDPGAINATVGNLLLYGSNLIDTTLATVPVETAPPWTERATGYIADRANLPAGTHTYRPTYPGVQGWLAQLLAFTTDDTAPATPTVSLAITAGNPGAGIPWQITAATSGTVDRVEFDVDTVLTETRTAAPYRLFDGATGLLGAGQHTIVARVYDTPGGTADDTDTLIVTEPGTAGTWLVVRELCDRVVGAASYKFYIDGTLNQTVPQPATGNPQVTFTFAGADTERLLEWSSVTATVESARAALRAQYTDPSATAIEGLTEVSRAYDGANWTVRYRWNRKPAPALSYNFYRDGSLIDAVAQPASGHPTFTDTFAGASVEKVIGVSAVYAGPVDGPRISRKFSYTVPATGAPKGGKELSRTYTP